MHIFFRKQQSAITQDERSSHVSLANNSPAPLATRFGTFICFLRTAFGEEAPTAPHNAEARLPIEIRMIENGPPILLKNLGFSTSERLNSVGRCTFELGYTKDDVTCLSFIINVVPGEIGGRFSQLTFKVRFLDPGK
jgi:hypothetical protein